MLWLEGGFWRVRSFSKSLTASSAIPGWVQLQPRHAMKLDTLNELFLEQIRDLYSAEQQLLNALPKMISAARATELKEALEHHLEETQNQVSRLDEILNQLNETPFGEECEAMKGLLKEADHVLSAQGDPAVIDAAIIAEAQRVEHYEIAGYGSARTFAQHLGYDRAASLLQDTLNEEGAADKKLTKLAEGGVFSSGLNEEATKKHHRRG
jgi:ferritin-like metal-binding protein YciE